MFFVEKSNIFQLYFFGGGDKVLYNKYGAANIKIDSEEFVILRQSDILCILEEDN